MDALQLLPSISGIAAPFDAGIRKYRSYRKCNRSGTRATENE